MGEQINAMIDCDFPFLRGLVPRLDEGIDQWCTLCEQADDPDGFGLYDEIESIVGSGFVVCQTYMMTRVRHRPKAASLKVGPLHRSNLHMAEIINAGANYWKHNREWPDRTNPPPLAKPTADVLRAVGVWGDDYTMTNLLHSLVDPAPLRIGFLLPHLSSWRDALDPGADAWWP